MKTLDEVIKANECCDHGEPDSRCEECPYNGLGACALEREIDTLHYLREYKAHQADWNYAVANSERFAEARDKHIKALAELKQKEEKYNDILTDYIALQTYFAEQQANPPITWDELEQMEGKPVWVEGNRGNMWIIVGAFPRWMPDAFADSVPNIWWKKEDLGKTWQAYRKERES